jgi:branched-chain amino acid aminotransferase
MIHSRYIQANSSGRLHRADEPAITPLNRGFLYGDAIYEVWRTYDGVIFGWDEHWARLERSAAALYLELTFTAETMLAEIRRTSAAFRGATGHGGDLYIRLQVTRGGGEIGLDTALADGVDYTLLVKPVPTLSEAQLEQGQRLSVVTGLRRNPAEALNPLWKTGNYLNNLLCLREVRARGADEAVILNLAGEVTEAAVCNVGFIRDGELITPPLSAGILAGITRELVLEKIAARAGVRAREQSVRPTDLGGMQEAFLLSTTKDLQPVGAIDAHVYTTGPATLTRRLKAVFADYAREVAVARRAELAV